MSARDRTCVVSRALISAVWDFAYFCAAQDFRNVRPV